ncbi:photosystem I reaction center subunit X [Phormidesmis priestleyi]
MLDSILLAADFPAAPASALLNWQGTPIIIGSCLFVLIVASRTIKYPHTGAKMPLPFSKSLFNDISVAGFLGSMSLGHILGVLLSLAIAGTGFRS